MSVSMHGTIISNNLSLWGVNKVSKYTSCNAVLEMEMN